MHQISLDWDKDYGINKRQGWSLTYDGMVIIELSSLWKVVFLGAWGILDIIRYRRRDARECGEFKESGE